jgi:hypothetical protein
LLAQDFNFLVDAEPIRPGEDEVAAAIRLLDRVYSMYPRAFDVVSGDGLYTDPRLYKWAEDHGKDALTVLKDERRDLLKDVNALCDATKPVEAARRGVECQWWDVGDLTSWSQVGRPVRVVRSVERRRIRRQLTREVEEEVSTWLWVTTLSPERASTRTVVDMGHDRWDIENQGFNETTTRWHGDHVYKHHADAMVTFWLWCMIAVNVFMAFYWRNLKPTYRSGVSMLHVSRLMSGQLYAELPQKRSLPP